MARGMNEFTSAVYSRNFAKCFRSSVLSHNPKRDATAERNAAPKRKPRVDVYPTIRVDGFRARAASRQADALSGRYGGWVLRVFRHGRR